MGSTLYLFSYRLRLKMIMNYHGSWISNWLLGSIGVAEIGVFQFSTSVLRSVPELGYMAKRESQRDINCHSYIYTVSREYIICGARWYDSYLMGTVRMEYCVCGVWRAPGAAVYLYVCAWEILYYTGRAEPSIEYDVRWLGWGFGDGQRAIVGWGSCCLS